MNKKLEKTGERVIVDAYSGNRNEYFIYQCHIATYQFALPYINDKKVLEFGCGSGYGSHYISSHCKDVTAVDISANALAYAKEKYKSKNLTFLQVKDIEKKSLDFQDESFDVVISFQVIEHLNHDETYLAELSRVLKKDGTIIIATPDRTYRLFSWQKPWNEFHIKEYSMQQLSVRVKKHFSNLQCYYMSAREDLLQMEISRTKKMRLLTLPFTLKFIPESIRKRTLNLLKKLNKKKQSNQQTSHDFDSKDIYISKEEVRALNLIVVAKK